LAHPAWKRWAVRRGPWSAGRPPAGDRTNQWTRCHWRRRSGGAGNYRERSGPPRTTWPGRRGRGPPGTTGCGTRRQRRADRGPACMGSAASRPKGCHGWRPTPQTHATWLRCSETPRRRRLPRHRTGPRSWGAVQPSPWLLRQHRGLLRGPRARVDRRHRNPGRARPGGVHQPGASLGWGSP